MYEIVKGHRTSRISVYRRQPNGPFSACEWNVVGHADMLKWTLTPLTAANWQPVTSRGLAGDWPTWIQIDPSACYRLMPKPSPASTSMPGDGRTASLRCGQSGVRSWSHEVSIPGPFLSRFAARLVDHVMSGAANNNMSVTGCLDQERNPFEDGRWRSR